MCGGGGVAFYGKIVLPGKSIELQIFGTDLVFIELKWRDLTDVNIGTGVTFVICSHPSIFYSKAPTRSTEKVLAANYFRTILQDKVVREPRNLHPGRGNSEFSAFFYV